MLGKEQRRHALYSLRQRFAILTFVKGNWLAQRYVLVCKCITILCIPSGCTDMKFEDPCSYYISHGFDKSSLLLLRVKRW